MLIVRKLIGVVLLPSSTCKLQYSICGLGANDKSCKQYYQHLFVFCRSISENFFAVKGAALIVPRQTSLAVQNVQILKKYGGKHHAFISIYALCITQWCADIDFNSWSIITSRDFKCCICMNEKLLLNNNCELKQ